MNARMTRFALATAAILAAAVNVGAPASARAFRTANTASISHGDLNLASAAGIARLDARVRRAAERLCIDPGVRPLHFAAQARVCVDEAVAAARPQLDRAIEQAARGRGAGSK
jgi:UrcA family protein